MLKEVDAKIYGPEDNLKKLVAEALQDSISSQIQNGIPKLGHNMGASMDLGASIVPGGDAVGDLPEIGVIGAETTHAADDFDLARREHFFRIRAVMGDVLVTLDEKNHVLASAADTLEKQLARCETSYSNLDDEISEEARYGNLHHWAYQDKASDRRVTTTAERTRRDIPAANNSGASALLSAEGEPTATRSESRREIQATRKKQEQRNQYGDSDFDDSRASKKTTGRGRKPADATNVPNGTQLGIINGAVNSSHKRRKIERSLNSSTVGPVAMERSISAVFGQNTPAARGRAGSPRDMAATDASKRRGRGGANIGNGSGRRRYDAYS
jgi:hypothetical protein